MVFSTIMLVTTTICCGRGLKQPAELALARKAWIASINSFVLIQKRLTQVHRPRKIGIHLLNDGGDPRHRLDVLIPGLLIQLGRLLVSRTNRAAWTISSG